MFRLCSAGCSLTAKSCLKYNRIVLKERYIQTMTANTTEKGKINERIAAFVCVILLLIVILITATEAVCYWIPGWWRKEYAKYNTPQYVTGEMSLDDAVYITEQMLEYCIVRLDTLEDTEATIDGVKAPFFTEREKLHLADCRNIFLGAVRFRMLSLLVIACLLIAVWFSVRKRCESQGGRSDRAVVLPLYSKILSRGYLTALAALAAFAVFLIIIGMNNFTFLFTKFHHVFFDNDLWILDPRHDNLVNVMQESVFSDAAITIGSIWAAVSALLAGISAFVLKKF